MQFLLKKELKNGGGKEALLPFLDQFQGANGRSGGNFAKAALLSESAPIRAIRGAVVEPANEEVTRVPSPLRTRILG